MSGGCLRTGTRPSLNLSFLIRTSVRTFNLKASQDPMSVKCMLSMSLLRGAAPRYLICRVLERGVAAAHAPVLLARTGSGQRVQYTLGGQVRGLMLPHRRGSVTLSPFQVRYTCSLRFSSTLAVSSQNTHTFCSHAQAVRCVVHSFPYFIIHSSRLVPQRLKV